MFDPSSTNQTNTASPSQHCTYPPAHGTRKLQNFQLQLMESMSMNLNHDILTRHLPLEITTEIFKLSLPENFVDLSLETSTSRYALAAPLVLSGVSRRWRNIVHSTPQLWSDLPLNLDLIAQDKTDLFLTLAREWIKRSDPCPLSINIYASIITNRAQAKEVIQLVNQYSFRWAQLTYRGPNPALSYFSSSTEGISQLRTLILQCDLDLVDRFSNKWGNGIFDLEKLILRPTRLEMRYIFFLKVVNIEWSYLTELTITTASVPDCLEVVRRAPRLTHCTLSPGFYINPQDHMHPDHFQLPTNPIVHEAIMNLTLVGTFFPDLLPHLLCPSLKNVTAKRGFGDRQPNSFKPMSDSWVDCIVEFVQRSGCPVTNFNIFGFEPSRAIVDSFCQGIPTLRHLHIEWFGGPEVKAHDYLFMLLAKASIGDTAEPLYLPDLRSLTVHQNSDVTMDWILFLGIFRPPTSEGRRFRSKLDSVELRIGIRTESITTSKIDIEEETQQELLSLREQGVHLKIQAGKDNKDII